MRDPFQRALSAYYDKVVKENFLGGGNWNITEYFRILVTHNYKNEHFTPQIEICDPLFAEIQLLGGGKDRNYDKRLGSDNKQRNFTS